MESKKRNFNEFSQNKIYKPNKKMKTEHIISYYKINGILLYGCMLFTKTLQYFKYGIIHLKK